MEKKINSALDSQILVAAGQRDKKELERLIAIGGDINAKSMRGTTALLSATGPQDEDFAIWLLEHGADPNAKNLTGEFPLLTAAAKGMETLVKKMLQAGGNPNERNNLGSTPLVEACLHRSPGVAKALLEGGADPNLRSQQGVTALLTAARNHDPDLVDLLLRNKANPNDADSYGVPAIIAAVSVLSRYDPKEDMPRSLETLKVLLKHGADPNLRAKSGNTAIAQASLVGNREAVITLVKAGADPNSCSTAGVRGEMTPLMIAAAQHDVELTDRLLDAGADPEFKNSKGETALQYAFMGRGEKGKEENGPKVVELLLKRGAKATQDGRVGLAIYAMGIGSEDLLKEAKSMGILDQKEQHGLTALHVALLQRKEKMAQTLLELGADPNAKDADGMAPLAVLARNPGNAAVEQMIKLLKAQEDPKHKAEGERLEKEMKSSLLNLAKLIVEKGGDPNAQDNKGETALTHAMRPFDQKMLGREFLDALVDLGGDITIRNENSDSAFVLAIKTADADLAESWAKRLLAEQKGDLVAQSILDLSWTAPEHPQAVEALRPALERLIALGAKIDCQDEDGQTPLIVAAATNQEALVHLLLDLGADINLRNKEGETPLIQAIANGHPNISKILLDRGADFSLETNEGEDAMAVAYKYQSATIINQISDARKARKASAGQKATV